MEKKVTAVKKFAPEIYFSISVVSYLVLYTLLYHTFPITKYSIGAILLASPFLGIPFGIMLGKMWKVFKIIQSQKI